MEAIIPDRKTLLIISGIACFSLSSYLYFSQTRSSKIQAGKVITDMFSPPTIAGFYHFATVGNHWKNVVSEQMLLAHASGLFKSSSKIYVIGLGNIDNKTTIFEMFADPKFDYEYDTRTEVYEYPILTKLEKFCVENERSLVWYAHSKGITYDGDGLAWWRGIMNHFVLDKWQLCHELLSSTNYTTCGAILTVDTARDCGWNKYYAGNMWWAKCSHVNRLTRIATVNQKDRYIAELYITSEPAVGHFNCFYQDIRAPNGFVRENASCNINYPPWRVR